MNRDNSRRISAIALPAALVCAFSASSQAGERSANASMTSNYIWRGLTQTENESAVQGGIDFASDSGFYVGTWASNVNYGAGDVYSYEHDVYAGFAFDTGDISWDVGYLYYNYDSEAEFDFGEVYIGMGIGNFSAQYNVLADTEADEAPGQDFGFGEAYYLRWITVSRSATASAFDYTSVISLEISSIVSTVTQRVTMTTTLPFRRVVSPS